MMKWTALIVGVCCGFLLSMAPKAKASNPHAAVTGAMLCVNNTLNDGGISNVYCFTPTGCVVQGSDAGCPAFN